MKLNVLRKVIEKNIPRWVVLSIDVYIVTNTFVLAYIINHNLSIDFDLKIMLEQIPIVMISGIVAFITVDLQKGIVRHSGSKDFEKIFKGAILLFIALCLFSYSLFYFKTLIFLKIPITTLIIHFLLNLIFLSGARYIFKSLYHKLTRHLKNFKNIMIYGAGDSGILTSAVFKDGREGQGNLIGFIDDNKLKDRNTINGIRIYHSSKIGKNFIWENKVKEIIVSIQDISPERLLEITDYFSELNVKVRIVPPISTWVKGKLEDKQIKEIKIEDLLGREAIKFENPTLEKEFSNKIILVTGAAGSIGSEIAKQVSHYKCKKLILLDVAESPLFNLQRYFVSRKLKNVEFIVSDVRNKERMEFLYKNFPIDIVFHASAYKHVPFMEENPYEAVKINVAGTRIMADLAVKYNVQKFVMISTDKAVNPTNVMGATKRLAELYVSSLKDAGTTKFITTRFGNVLGSNGSVIPIFSQQIKEGGPITVTHKDITRFFMTIPEACRLVLEAGAMGSGGEIFVFDMGKSVKIFDLAVKMIKLSGLKYPDDIDIEIIGLRPGEKIYEEVLSTEENTMPTYHKQIKIAKVREISIEQIQKQISELCEVISTMDKMKIVGKMKEIVPEFISNNSEFTVLDNKK